MTPVPRSTIRPAAPLAAIGFVLLSTLLYIVGYSLSKTLVESHGLSPVQVTFIRCASVLLVGVGLAGAGRGGITVRRLLQPQRAGRQRWAAGALILSNILAIVAYSLLPVTDASALSFAAPLLLTAMGGLLLGERVGLHRWLGAALGFTGMLLIVRPALDQLSPGIVASLGAAVCYAWYQTLVRQLRDVATSLDTALQVGLVGTLLLLPALGLFWKPIGVAAFGVALVFTGVQTAALASIAAALRRAETSRLAPWQFSGLVWAMLIDAMVFARPPVPTALAGGLLIVAGGLWAQRPVDTGRGRSR